MAEIVRTGIFYDGSFFAHVSDHYRYHHRRAARISFAGLHDFIRQDLAAKEAEGNASLCRIVEAHYFRGRFSAEDADKHDALLRDRRFEDVLTRAGIMPHFLLMPSLRDDGTDGSRIRGRGIDVWLALEAYELALRRQLSVVVLVTGDADFLPLVRKLTAIGARTMLTGWDLLSPVDGSRTRTAQVLLDAATYPVMMNEHIDGRAANRNFAIDNLFMPGGLVDPQQGALRREPENTAPEDSELLDANLTAEAHSSSSLPDNFAVGVIDNVVFDKGFGFIRPESGGDNLFFHASDVEGCEFAELRLEDAVRYVVAPNPKDGRPAARRVSRVAVAGSP